MSSWSDPELHELFLSHTPLIDVRAPIEFQHGALPGAVNLPLMNDDERHRVGLCYKDQGQAAAIELGHQLVSGEVKDQRVRAWVTRLQAYPHSRILCFRGGLRSQTSCQWVTEAGIPQQPLAGGYKRARQFLLSWLEEAPLPQLFRLGGLTGSGKTEVLRTLPHYADIEELAHHRGSAFGNLGAQPAQVTFENALAVKLLENPRHLIVEDESAVLGRIALPRRFFAHMRTAPIVILETSLEERVKNIYRDYVLTNDPSFFLAAVQRISRQLGGVRAKQVTELLQAGFAAGAGIENHSPWISELLENYYDPLYRKDILRQGSKVLFRGDRSAVTQYFSEALKGSALA
jgi:tRNA 2-selenouridine synthase